MKKKKEMRIRGVDESLYWRIENIADKYKYPSLNHFMLYQLYLISENAGLDRFQNRLSDQFVELKNTQKEILHKSAKIDLDLIKIDAKMRSIDSMMDRWSEFMYGVESINEERGTLKESEKK